MAEPKGWRSIPKGALEGVAGGTKEVFKAATKTILLAAGAAGLRWVQEHRQEIRQGVRHGALSLERRAKRLANRPMQGLQAVKNRRRRETPASSAKRR